MKKKIIITLLVILLPIKLNALEIEKIYTDAEIEIGGGLNVKTLIKVINNNEPLNYNIYVKDNNLKEFKGEEDDFVKSKIYNATFAEVLKVGELTNDDYFSKLYEENFIDNIKFYDKINQKSEEDYHIVSLESDKKEITYYLEYKVMNVLVEHLDSAEFYYKYLNNFNYDIKEIKILTTLPSNSKLFEVWAHGNDDWKVKKDTDNKKVLLEKTNYKKDETIELRILYDKDLFAVNINKDKKTNMKALPIIKKIEDERKRNTNAIYILKHSLVVLSILLIVLVISFIANKILKKKKIKKKKN